MRLSTVLLAVLLLVPALAVDARDSAAAGSKKAVTADPQVKRLLEELEYKYEIDGDGDYKLVFDMDSTQDKRTQLVFVRSPVETFGAHKVREIWSPGYQAKGGDDFPAAVANRLLEATQASKLGAWAKQDDYAVFVVKLPADATAKQLDDAIDAAIRSADDMEAELTPGQDAF